MSLWEARYRYLVLASAPWAQSLPLPHAPRRIWTTISAEDDLDEARCCHPPDITFVPHWHWRIPGPTIDHDTASGRTYIGFHASDLPNFRGGAPIENQQRRGITETKLTAFRLVEQLDAGPILLQEPLSLAGTKADVLARIAALVPGMMTRIIAGDYTERAQGPGGSFYTRKDAER